MLKGDSLTGVSKKALRQFVLEMAQSVDLHNKSNNKGNSALQRDLMCSKLSSPGGSGRHKSGTNVGASADEFSFTPRIDPASSRLINRPPLNSSAGLERLVSRKMQTKLYSAR
jgi:hypothetical protein